MTGINLRMILQYTRLHCSILGYIAVHWATLQSTRLYCSALSYTAVHWTLLQYTGLYFSTLSYTAVHWAILQYIELHCSTLSYTAVHWATLQYTDLQSSTLSYTTVHWARFVTSWWIQKSVELQDRLTIISEKPDNPHHGTRSVIGSTNRDWSLTDCASIRPPAVMW